MVRVHKAKPKPARQTKRGSSRKRLHPEVEEAWEKFVDHIKVEYALSKNRALEIECLKQAAKSNGEKIKKSELQSYYDKPDSVLKREVYRFVKDNFTPSTIHKLEKVVDDLIDDYREMRTGFSDNFFHWVFLALASERIVLKPYEITRYSRQLLYALRHGVDPDLLVGFLYQTGSPDEIGKRALDKKRREEWYMRRKKRS
jgi:hypothetical protein